MQNEDYTRLIGKRLVHSIWNPHGVLMISSNVILTESHIIQLKKLNINMQAIHVKEAIHDPSYEQIKQAESGFQEIQDFVYHNGKLPDKTAQNKVLPSIIAATKKRNLFSLLEQLRSHEDFRYKHSLAVAIVAIKLGKWLHLPEAELELLSLAASLFDIGSVKLPSTMLDSNGRYQAHEKDIVKQHTIFGYEILMNSDVNPRVALAALQHHERIDGSGYPSGLIGNEIDPISQIIAVADVYVAMISERPHRKALPFHEVIQTLQNDVFQGKFDSKIGLTFLNMLMSMQVGKEVRLLDGRLGTIVLTNVNYPTRPVVEIEGKLLDLRVLELEITEVLG
ncbi:HD domain-containing protein [Paenibacillus sp. HWE-109]|uniref:HD-GYP domain-containing protein n=1 Tax=Paenibacillus sp. HWE-109 TaxID=1306526 RepID=UPI001EE04C1F|nr:HD domain-containing phosphohydrolase [Paenibacillus sp. HWE-109]UKS29364.1 HD domain-containing protein [Paenibacillus sp. HWE-109]